MIRRLSFNPADSDHRLFYELGHVLIVTDVEKRSRSDEDRLVDLQKDWEDHGKKVGEEKVVGTGEFVAYRFVLEEDAESFDFYIEDAAYDLLKKIVAEAPVSGHVRRYRRPLVAFVEAAEKGKLAEEGVFAPIVKPEKKEDRADRSAVAKRRRTPIDGDGAAE